MTGLAPYAAVLAVRDMTAMAAYFRDRLGFTVAWEEADGWRLLSRDAVRVMIGACPDAAAAGEIGDHSLVAYWHVGDVDALHREISERGAIVRIAPRDMPYGQREMVVATPEGHRVIVGQTLPAAARR